MTASDIEGDTSMPTVTTKTIASEKSWVIRCNTVELAITQTGGHMAPVTFARDSSRPIRPYYVNPWHEEKVKFGDADAVLKPLRGDFFCFPFGANEVAYRGEKHPCHGQTASQKWSLVESSRVGSVATLALKMKTKVRPGCVVKRIFLHDNQNVVYTSHEISGYGGAMPLGHHAILAVPEKERSLQISTSAILFGATPAGVFGDPTIGHYQSFQSGQTFKSLKRVPLMFKDSPWADTTRFPDRQGYTDFLAVFNKPLTTSAWSAVVNTADRYLWFSLKDPTVLPTTGMWFSNRGRHSSPWNGRNCCLGMEDICSYFADGIEASVKANELSKQGITTAIKLSASKPTFINYIQGAIPVPVGFDRVRSVRFSRGEVIFRSYSGKSVSTPVCHGFIKAGPAILPKG